MSLLLLSDLDKVCRGCLGKNGEMRPLFGSFLDNMLRIVAEIEVQANDGLPQLMCVPCVLQVSRAFTFKQQCKRSDTALRSIFDSNAMAETVDNIAIDLNAVRTIDANKVILTPIECREVSETKPHVMINEQQQQQLQTDSEPTVEMTYDTTTDVDSIDEKCLLIVHSVPANIMADDLDEPIGLLEATDDLASNDSHYITTADIIEANQQVLDDAQTLLTDDMDDSELDAVIFDDKEDLMHDGDIDDDILIDHFDDTSDNETNMSTANTENILDLLVSQDTPPPLTSDSKYFCTECSQSFDTKTDYKIHRQTVHNSFKCNVCGKIFAENKILKRHLKIHNPNKPHSCSVCMMKFAESSNLTKHMKKHTGELRNVVGKPNLCSVCGRAFKWASSLSKHMKHHTKHKILNCPYCPKYYVEARSLNIHLRSHTGEKPFVCKICNKAFTQLGNLEKHIRVHTGEKPFQCPVCKKGFSQSGYVAIHLRTHTGERPYVCCECGKGFASSNTLAIHKRTHTGEKPYSCNICNKSFARQETVVIHQRTHTGEKPHICSLCNRGFASSGHLTGHMRSHTGEKTHECNICGKRLAGSSSLKVHMKTHEKLETVQNHTNDLIDDAKELTIFECSVCNQNVTTSTYEHQIVDGVLICSNLDAIGNADLVDDMHVHASDVVHTADDDIVNGANQQVMISLQGLKEEIF